MFAKKNYSDQQFLKISEFLRFTSSVGTNELWVLTGRLKHVLFLVFSWDLLTVNIWCHRSYPLVEMNNILYHYGHVLLHVFVNFCLFFFKRQFHEFYFGMLHISSYLSVYTTVLNRAIMEARTHRAVKVLLSIRQPLTLVDFQLSQQGLRPPSLRVKQRTMKLRSLIYPTIKDTDVWSRCITFHF